MPEISRFYGLVVKMFHNDHAPPHFHVEHADDQVVISIENLAVLAGRLRPRALGLAMEWASLHQDELRRNWELAQGQETLLPVDPLP